MPWVKQSLSQGRIAYIAPPEAAPITKITYDPRVSQPKWAIEYLWLEPGGPTIDTIAAIEAIMQRDSGLV